MKKTCSICGIVDEGHICPYKKRYEKSKEPTKLRKFRNTKVWARKAHDIKQRDKYLCVACAADIDDVGERYTYDKLEVHHIVPLSEDFNKRLTDSNLITLCQYHHKRAEHGEIEREILKSFVKNPPLPSKR